MTESVRLTEPGCSLCKAPHHGFHYRYFLNLPGCEYFQVYLWLMKDWSWNQLSWMGTTFIFGLLALLWIAAMVSYAFIHRIYSEAYIGTAAFLWLLANFIWMCGEYWELDGYENGAQVYNTCHNIARGLITTSVSMLCALFVVFWSLGLFRNDKGQILEYQLDLTSPPAPKVASSFFKDFHDWETIHILLWATKDMFWVWQLWIPYIIAFSLTLLFSVDLIWRFSTYTNQYIDTVHAIVIFLWVLANGIWALGELDTEQGLTAEDMRSYTFTGPLSSDKLLPRRLAGWVFLFTFVYVFVFFLQWVYVTLRGNVPTYYEYMRKLENAISTIKVQTTGTELVETPVTNGHDIEEKDFQRIV